jgi:hypothetical protein
VQYQEHGIILLVMERISFLAVCVIAVTQHATHRQQVVDSKAIVEKGIESLFCPNPEDRSSRTVPHIFIYVLGNMNFLCI